MSGVNEPTVEGAQAETPAAPTPGTPEHDAAMAAKYQEANGAASEATTEETPAEGTQSELIAGKFQSQEELIAAYEELLAKQEPKAGEETADGEETPEANPEDTEAPAALASVFEAAASEYESGKDITAETRAKLVEGGIPAEFIDTYIAGVQAQEQALMSEAHGLCGGEDNWNAMMTWAASLPENEINAFNKAVLDPATTSLAVQGLFARFSAAEGTELPSVTAGASHAAIGADVYNSTAEMTADMRDARYKADPAFRKTVEQKIARSRTAGTLGALGVAY